MGRTFAVESGCCVERSLLLCLGLEQSSRRQGAEVASHRIAFSGVERHFQISIPPLEGRVACLLLGPIAFIKALLALVENMTLPGTRQYSSTLRGRGTLSPTCCSPRSPPSCCSRRPTTTRATTTPPLCQLRSKPVQIGWPPPRLQERCVHRLLLCTAALLCSSIHRPRTESLAHQLTPFERIRFRVAGASDWPVS